MKSKPAIGYMCAVDYEYHLENDYYGTTVYPSIKALKDQRQCTVKGCGIVRVKTALDIVVTKGRYS